MKLIFSLLTCSWYPRLQVLSHAMFTVFWKDKNLMSGGGFGYYVIILGAVLLHARDSSAHGGRITKTLTEDASVLVRITQYKEQYNPLWLLRKKGAAQRQ